MPIEFKKTTYKGKHPEIWRGECKILPGGFKPKNTISTGTTLNRGTLLQVMFDTMEAAVIKVSKVLNGGSTSKPRIGKGHTFAVGDVVMKVGKDDKTVTVSKIDNSKEDYDVLELSAAITGLAANDILIEAVPYGYVDAESGDEGALTIVANDTENPTDSQIKLNQVTPYLGEETLEAGDYVKLQKATPLYTPNMIVGAVKTFDGKGLPTIDAAYEAVVLYPSLNFPLLPEWLNGCCLKSNPNILFIKQ